MCINLLFDLVPSINKLTSKLLLAFNICTTCQINGAYTIGWIIDVLDLPQFNIIIHYHGHENYEHKWRKDRSKSKSKTQNKKIKIRTQMLKPKTWNIQNQSITNFYYNEARECRHKKNKVMM